MSAQAPVPPAPTAVSTFRFAPAVVARFAGALVVAVAALIVLVTVVVAVADLPVGIVLGVAVVGLLAALGAAYALGRRAVVRLDAEGYRVRVLRGAGVAAAPWREVREAATDTRGGVPVVVLRLADERTTTIPVTVLDVDREQFVRTLQGHLQRGHGLRPIT